MRKIMKRAFAAVIVAVMVLCAAPLSGIADFIVAAQAAGGYRVGDTLYFGRYPQSEITDSFIKTEIVQNDEAENGIISYNGNLYYREGKRIFEYEPIQWRVLSVASDGIYVMSEKTLDSKMYNNVNVPITWADCTLRTWLNSYFYNFAFSSTEKKAVKLTRLINADYAGNDGGIDTYDRVWIPSLSDVTNSACGFSRIGTEEDSSRAALGTPYRSNGGYWWLRTHGQSTSSSAMCVVEYSGYIHGITYYQTGFGATNNVGVRPAMKLDLNSSSYKVKSNSNYSIKVVDDTTGQPVSGASISFEGNTIKAGSSGSASLRTSDSSSSTSAVRISAKGYATQTLRLYELNPYSMNTINLSSESNPVSMALADLYLNGDEIKGPTVNILGKTFPLFKFSGGINIPLSDIVKVNVSTENDTRNKTAKYILGVNSSYSVDTDSARSEDYQNFKDFYKSALGGSNQNALNKYNKLRRFLKDEDGSLGFSCGIKFAGYLEFSYATGNMVLKDGGIIVTAEAAVSTDVPFAGICYATFKIGGEFSGDLKLSQTSSGLLSVSTKLSLSLKPTIGVGAKLLMKDLASIEVGIDGKFTGDLEIPADSFRNAFSLYLSAQCYIKAKALFLFENKWSTNFPNLELYPNFGQFQTSSAGSFEIDENGNVVTINKSDLKLIDRSYNDNKQFHTSSVTGNDYLNDTSVYPYGYPELVQLDDGRVMALYLYDDGTKSDINRTTLYYSIYNNNQWSVPLPVNNSGLADFPVKVCSSGNKIYAVWQRAAEVMQDSYEIEDVVDKTELVYAEFNGTTWTKPVTIDTAGKYQMLYSIAEKDGKVAVEWAENSENNYTLESGTTTVYYKTLADGAWSDVTTVDSGKGIADASIGFAGDNIKVVYSVDADGDLTTANDSEIYVNGTKLTSNEVDEGEISYQNGKFYWIQGAELFEYDGGTLNNTGLKIENDYRVLTNGKTTAVTSFVTDGFKNELVVSYKNGNTYTKPVALTEYGKHIGYYDGILNSNGSISVLADVDNLSGNKDAYPYTTTDMVCDIISGKKDLGIENVTVSDNVSVGSTVTFDGTVINSGTTPIDSYSVFIKDSKNNVLTEKPVYDTILPGGSKQFSVDYTLPVGFAKQDVTASVSVDGDVNDANNSKTVTVGYTDIAVAEASIARDGTITATIVNNGIETAKNVSVKYNVIDGASKTSLSTFSVGTVAAGEIKTVTYSVPAAYLKIENSYCVNKFELDVTTDSEELSVANNTYDVVYAPIAVESISLNTSVLSLEYGQTAQLVATVYPSNAFNKGVHFVSDSTDVATVDDNGNIITVGSGTAIITAITDDGDYIAQCQVTVSVKVKGVDLDQKDITINVGNTIALKANINPDVASDKTVEWTSSDTSVATVDKDGVVRGVKTGSTTITAKTNDGGFEASCTVNVINAVKGITVSDTRIALYPNKTKQLKASVTPVDADNPNVVWESNDDEVATVSETGLVTAKMPGTATITVKSVDGEYTATCTVTVGKHVSSIILSDTELTMPAGTSETLYATVMPLAAFNKTVTWVSTNPKVATVDENGNVKAIKAGTTTIIAYCEDGDVTASCIVTVTNSATGIEMSESEVYIARNSQKQLNATVKPDTAENKNITWESKYPEIATVDSNGLVTAKMAGTTIVVATSADGEFKAYCSVKVVGVDAVSTASIDYATGIITGLSSNLNSLDNYIEVTDESCELKYDKLGTDSIVYLTRNDEVIDAYTVVLFGDVNGDGWYDGRDAVTVSMIANGMLSREQVGEAVWMAADCNHDGKIDQADVDLLNQAGLLLSSVDQTKSTEELLETSSEYNEYLNLIDQSVEVKSDEPVNDETEAPLLHKRWIDKLIDFILYVIKNIIMIYIRIY